MTGELRILLDGDLASDGKEDDEKKDGDGGDPVALLPETHGLHASIPVNDGPGPDQSGGTLSGKTDMPSAL
ncbi:hypothetical protein GCM10022280_18020 [Sphingomonas swuensis]|uniref:Uncharacterized protein n=1 Tax=Sphingomonas swuensis TaxID=977800 RepID=A0ABP7SZU5_9SPHN